MIALTKSLGKELAQSGIIVNCVAPAMVQTDLLGGDDAGVHKDCDGQDPDGTIRDRRGERRDGGVAVQRRVQFCYGGGV